LACEAPKKQAAYRNVSRSLVGQPLVQRFAQSEQRREIDEIGDEMKRAFLDRRVAGYSFGRAARIGGIKDPLVGSPRILEPRKQFLKSRQALAQLLFFFTRQKLPAGLADGSLETERAQRELARLGTQAQGKLNAASS
jgi:hypothetical protein